MPAADSPERPARSPIWRQEDVALLLIDDQPETFSGCAELIRA